MKTPKSQIAILVLNQCSVSAVFLIVRFAGDQKTALSGESLYLQFLPGVGQILRDMGPGLVCTQNLGSQQVFLILLCIVQAGLDG